MATLTHSSSLRTLLLATALFAALVCTQFLPTTIAEAQSGEPTYPFKLTKSISDNYTPDPFTAVEFKFNVSGYGVVNLIAHTNDTAENVIYLPAGIYTVEEIGPAGFVPSDWTVQWSGHGCVGDTGNGPIRSIDIEVVEAVDPDAGGNVCKADNQWRPLVDPQPIFGCTDPDANNYDPDATDDDGTCEFDDPNAGGQTGTLIVEKIVVGGTATTTDFSFSVNGGTQTAFEADGSNSMTVASSIYSVVETPIPTGYTASYNNCTDVFVASSATTTCTITNTYNSNGGGNGGDDDAPTYLVFGYVWHDENANTEWETDEPNPDDDEIDLDAWTVEITNGSTTFATTTDATGYYYFYVEAGTWTINEVLQSGWTKTFPVVNGHVVVVIDESITEAKTTNFFASVMQFLVPVAYAQTTTTYGPFDFGNVYYGTGGGNGGDNDNGGGGNGGSNGGGGSSGGSGGGGGTPTVLGDATDTMPLGAPDTGAGGTSPISFGFLMVTATLPRKIYW